MKLQGKRIIRVLAKNMRVAEDFGFGALAKKTHGYWNFEI